MAQALTPKEQKFVQEYLLHGNATQAAVAAGYSSRSARQVGSKLLTKHDIRAAVDAGQAKVADKFEIKREEILGELLRIARFDLGQVFNADCTLKHIHDMPEDARRALSSIETDELFEGASGEKFSAGKIRKLKTYDKVRALELLGKNLKLFTDKVEVDGNVRISIVDPYAEKPK